jgi:hypothetical protein
MERQNKIFSHYVGPVGRSFAMPASGIYEKLG